MRGGGLTGPPLFFWDFFGGGWPGRQGSARGDGVEDGMERWGWLVGFTVGLVGGTMVLWVSLFFDGWMTDEPRG